MIHYNNSLKLSIFIYLSILYLNACDTYLAMFEQFFATVKGITYLCVVKLYRILQCLIFFSILQFKFSACSIELKISDTLLE